MPGNRGNSVVPRPPWMRFTQPGRGGNAPERWSTAQTPSSSLTGSRVPGGARTKRALPTHGGAAREGAAGRRRRAFRAEVGRLPGGARERRWRACALVAQRAPAPALLPRASAARRADAAALGARRGDRDRARRRARLRFDGAAAAPAGAAHPEAPGEEPGGFRRLGRAALGRGADPRTTARAAPREGGG